MDDIMPFLQSNWHKIIIVIMVMAHAWKFFFQYIRPTITHEKAVQPISIVLPPQGCTITVVPLPVEKPEEDD